MQVVKNAIGPEGQIKKIVDVAVGSHYTQNPLDPGAAVFLKIEDGRSIDLNGLFLSVDNDTLVHEANDAKLEVFW